VTRNLPIIAACCAVVFSACGRGAMNSQGPVPIVPAGGRTASSVAAAFSIGIPLGSAIGASVARSAQFASPSTANIYIALQSSDGHGDPAFSYAEKIDSTSCTMTPTERLCTYKVVMPVGSDTFSILTTNGAGVPLTYANFAGIVGVDGTLTRVAPDGNELGGIIAGAVASYAYRAIASGYPAEPVVTVAVADAAGDALPLGLTSDSPQGDTISTYTATQDVGWFDEEIVTSAPVTFAGPASTYQGGSSARAIFLHEIGTGAPGRFTTHITVTTPQVQYTNVEFPMLPTSTATVPASSSSLTLMCTFLTPAPAANPCA
jgi:hypothetical protein